jgi:activator of HSP90 ATPase
MKSYRTTLKIAANTKSIYGALTSSKTFQEWSGQPAEIEAYQGGQFWQFGGNIQGKFLILTPTKILQLWKEKTWKNFSKVSFTINEKGSHTELEVQHEDIPDENYEMIKEGWDKYYLGPLRKYFQS